MKKHALLTTALLVSASISYGAGFQVGSQGVRQLGMGGTGTSVPWDVATIFYNPAGLSRLQGMQAMGSVQFLTVNTRYVQTPIQGITSDTRSEVFTPFNLYIGGPIPRNDRFGIGLGIYTPFGNGMTWADNWPGRYLVQSISMRTIFFQPTVSYRISDVVSVGAGFVYGIGNIEMKRAIPVQDVNGREGSGKLKGSGNGVGVNLGVHIKPSEVLQFGINYRSAVTMEFDGDATFIVPSVLRPDFPNTGFKSDVPLPQVLTAGIGYKPADRITIQLEANFTGWNTFDSLGFRFDQQTAAIRDGKSARHYQNTVAFRLGGLFELTDRMQVMLGTFYDPTPVTDGFVSPDLPDSDRWAVSGGLTFKATDRLTLLGAMEFGTSVQRDAQFLPDNFNGRYAAKAFTANIGVSYDF